MTSEQQATSSERVKEIMARAIKRQNYSLGLWDQSEIDAKMEEPFFPIELDRATAAIKALEAAGYVWVPIEPMIERFHGNLHNAGYDDLEIEDVISAFRAAIKAAGE